VQVALPNGRTSAVRPGLLVLQSLAALYPTLLGIKYPPSSLCSLGTTNDSNTPPHGFPESLVLCLALRQPTFARMTPIQPLGPPCHTKNCASCIQHNTCSFPSRHRERQGPLTQSWHQPDAGPALRWLYSSVSNNNLYRTVCPQLWVPLNHCWDRPASLPTRVSPRHPHHH